MNTPDIHVPHPVPPEQQRRGVLLVSLGLFLLTILVYWSSIHGQFVQWDDDINIYKNPHLQGDLATTLGWAWTDSSHVRRYIPLAWTGWIFQQRIDGLSPTTYHLGNILFHAGNAVLVFLFLRLLLQQLPLSGSWTQGKRQWLNLSAALGGLFWALHPLRVEAVAWASGRVYCQALFFLLLSWVLYLHHTRRQSEGQPDRWPYWSAVICYAASLLSYPLGLAGVLVFVLLDIYPLKRFQRGSESPAWGKVILQKLPFVMVALTVAGLTIGARMQASGDWKPPVGLESFGVVERVMQAAYVWACFLWKTWWPTNLTPLDTTLVTLDPYQGRFLMSLGLIGLVSVAVVFCRKRFPGLGILWLGYLAVLVPMLGLTEHPHYPSDRYSYLAGLAWSVLIGVVLWKAVHFPVRRKWSAAVGYVLVGALGWLSYQQCQVWRNTETLFTHILSKLGDDPARFDIHHRLGQYFLGQGEFAEAEASFRDELKAKPGVPRGLYFLGNSLVLQERHADALTVYDELLDQVPRHRKAVLNYGRTLSQLKRHVEAFEHFIVAGETFPEDVDMLLEAGHAARRSGAPLDAIRYYEKAEQLDPESVKAATLISQALVEAGMAREARAVLEESLLLQPDQRPVLLELAWLLATHANPEVRDPEKALDLASRAHRDTGMASSRALDVLAAAYANSDRFSEAQSFARQAMSKASSRKEHQDIQARLQLYMNREPHRDAPSTAARP